MGGHPAHGRALLLKKFKRGLSPPSLNQNILHHYRDFWPPLRPISVFAGSFSTVVVVVLPPLRPASDAFVRSLAKFPEFEFLEVGMILFLFGDDFGEQPPA